MRKCLYIMLFTCFSMYAQDLYISNGDYLFANDIEVTVNNDIRLNGTNSFIYLRGDAQLLQKNNVQNSGDGILSVYQDGTVNEYAYNYWCSPVGLSSGASGNNPFGVTMFHDITGLITSTPATANHNASYSGTANPLNIEPNWIWTFIASDEYSEWQFEGANNTIQPGEGFTMKGTAGTSANNPGSNQNYDFRGRPNSGTISHTVAAPLDPTDANGDGNIEEQFTLIGNPYPSALDAHALIWDPTNQGAINGVLQFWEQAIGAASHNLESYVGGYALYTISELTFVDSFTPAAFTTYLGDGTATNFNAGSGTKTAQRYIPIGQGFMVSGSAPTSGSVFIRNDFRAYIPETAANSYFFEANTDWQGHFIGEDESNTSSSGNETQFLENGYNLVPEGFLRFRINVDLQEGTNYYTRQLLMNLVDYATDGHDRGLEARSSIVLDSDAHWIYNGIPYGIQAFPFDMELRIPLVVTVDEQQPLRFRIYDVQNFNEDQPIYIHDKEDDLYIDLREQNYQINIEPGLYDERFEITFINFDPLSVPEATINDLEIFQNNDRSELTILNPNQLELENVQLFDMNGKQIFNESVDVRDEYFFSTSNLSNGVYVASIKISGQNEIHKKIIITN